MNSSMLGAVSAALFGSVIIGAASLAPTVNPATSPLQKSAPRFLSLFEGDAEASVPGCTSGTRRQENVYHWETKPSGCHCGQSGNDPNANVPYLRTTYCDGRVTETPELTGQNNTPPFPVCQNSACAPYWNSCSTADLNRCDPFILPPVNTVICESPCPEEEHCSQSEASCPTCTSNCIGKPISMVGETSGQLLGAGALFFRLPVFPLGQLGFPKDFEILFTGQSGFSTYGSVGARAMDNLEPTAVFVPGTPNRYRVATMEGETIPFVETSPGSNTWVTEDGRPGISLSASDTPACPGGGVYTVLTLADGTVAQYWNYCDGSTPSQGTLYSVLFPDQYGFVETTAYQGQVPTNWVTTIQSNNSTAKVILTHSYTGELESVTTPAGDVFNFSYSDYDGRYLTQITRAGDGSIVWSINYLNPFGGSYYALENVEDGENRPVASWTYTDSNGTRTASEALEGGGARISPTYSFIDSNDGSDSVALADGNGTRGTDTYTYAQTQSSGERARITGRVINAACPNCGDSSATFSYWAGEPTNNPPLSSTDLRTASDGNGSFTLYEDPLDIGQTDTVAASARI